MKLTWITLYKIIFNPLSTGLLAPFVLCSRKARESLLAHVGLFRRVKQNLEQNSSDRPTFWVHVASAGEYLQAKPLVQMLLKKKYRVFLTVTSISGYRWLQRQQANPSKNHKGNNKKNNKDSKDKNKESNLIFDFLPLDFSHNARKMLDLVNPAALIFVKTDIWPNLLGLAQKRDIPRILVCAGKRNAGSGLKRSFYKFLYGGFSAIFTVNGEGEKFFRTLLKEETFIKTVGDSKYDIVMERKKERSLRLPSIKSADTCALFGSVWPEDLKVIARPVLNALENFPKLKIIVAPHENHDKKVLELLELFKVYEPVLFSSLGKTKGGYKTPFRVMIVDTIGDLFYLYENSSVSYVGGGFSTGIHNILEPCSWKNTVIFGPRHQKFPEAQNLLLKNCAQSIQNTTEFEKAFNELLADKKLRLKKGRDCLDFVTHNTGASQKMFADIIKMV